MDFEKILAQLCGERDLLDKVIADLQILAREDKRGRDRPSGSVTKSAQSGTSPVPEQ
jgi:hypothetical protein